ncbi:hypothetical protein [Candidatus Nitrosotenuis sp. DW1]|uniref:hypothetical protein n=1 Tax=Candidatus Nitrosotenuis sp. DW1 TaxID=2259672 RepID=UPI0015C764BA|nr:hypothetical protein [Candidatus Nitrosotenuis sp. DW1]
MKFQALASASLEDCGAWSNIYRLNVATVNNAVSTRFGTEEVSQRVADHVTSGGSVSDSIGSANNAAKVLVDSCFYNDKSVIDVFGGFNQNIIDSVALYSNVPFKEIPIFGSKLTSYSILAANNVSNYFTDLLNIGQSKLNSTFHEAYTFASGGSADSLLILGAGLATILGGKFAYNKMKNKDDKSDIWYKF